jgi:hypothetical protein
MHMKFEMESPSKKLEREVNERLSKGEARRVQKEVEGRKEKPKAPDHYLFSPEDFLDKSESWLTNINEAQAELMKEITISSRLGKNMDELDARAKLLENWHQKLWVMCLDAGEAQRSGTDTMKVDSAFVKALESDPNAAAASQIEKQGTETRWNEQIRESSENLKAQEALKTREMNAQREVSALKESMQVLDDRMDAIQKGIKELDQREELLFKKGMLPGNPEIMNELDIEREELSKLHEKSFDSFHKVMRNFNKLLDHFSEVFTRPDAQAN